MRLLPLALLLALVAAGCGGASEAQVTTTEVRDGIVVQMTLGATHDGLSVEARIENQRTEPLVLRQDGCGYAGVAEVARTTHQPRGRRWSGSIRALKRLVLEDQATSEAPEPMTAVRKRVRGRRERRDADAEARRRAQGALDQPRPPVDARRRRLRARRRPPQALRAGRDEAQRGRRRGPSPPSPTGRSPIPRAAATASASTRCSPTPRCAARSPPSPPGAGARPR